MLKRVGVLTSGGDSPGMNPAIRAVTRAGLTRDMEIIGIENGYQGIFDRQFIKLSSLDVSGKSRESGTFLASTRCKRFYTEEGQQEAVKILREEKLDALVVIGGDGSLTGAQKLHALGYPVIGLPGTIDNDLYGTDMGIGVDTALNTIIHLVDMVKATAASHRRCFVIEVMGRHCGYLALMSTISTGSQVAVIPEYRVNMESIITALTRRMERKHNNSVVIVAEGVCTGQEFMNRLNNETQGRLNQEVRLTVLGHVQRGGAPTHFDRLLASRMGEYAILALEQGDAGTMVALSQGKMQLRDLDQILGKKKALPADAVRLARNLGIEIGDVVES
ncbi:MAG: 6-phosphofructokinase [Candidatus Methylacidiphilales bacterium]|nr:6-phosphofructokinase [Candidatus Methylacidiphilales bacterium]